MRLNTQIQTTPGSNAGQIKADSEGVFNFDVKTSFHVYDANQKIVGKKDVMLLKEHGFNSEGTERLFFYLGWILAALDQGRVIFIDELDSKLHFLIADYLVSLFNSIDENPKNGQLIATAHDVMLMDGNLRRDQIYFTSKDGVGKSYLTSLADYRNVRKTDLFSKKYLAGLYASLPDMKRVSSMFGIVRLSSAAIALIVSFSFFICP